MRTIEIDISGTPNEKKIPLGNKYENNDEILKFVLPEIFDSYNKYVIAVMSSQSTVIIPMVDNQIYISSGLTHTAGNWSMYVMCRENALDLTTNPVDISAKTGERVFISDAFIGFVADNLINADNIKNAPLDSNLQIVYDELLDLINQVNTKLENGEFNGKDGIDGKNGADGKSAYEIAVQNGFVGTEEEWINSTATKEDITNLDNRFSNALTGTASGSMVHIEDASPIGTLRNATILGATVETGTGDKSPDNQYVISGVEPTNITVCGKNIAPIEGVWWSNQNSDVSYIGNNKYRIYRDNSIANWVELSLVMKLPAGVYTLSYSIENFIGTLLNVSIGRHPIKADIVNYTKGEIVTFELSETTIIRICWQSQNKLENGEYASSEFTIGDIQLECGSLSTVYKPYTGTTAMLSTIDTLYSLPDGTKDEYDAAIGVETRKIRKVALTGDETWYTYNASGIKIYYAKLDNSNMFTSFCVSSHYPTADILDIVHNSVYPAVAVGTNFFGSTYTSIAIRDDNIESSDTLKTFLAAQYTAGTPVTVLYKLAEPVITQHDPLSIKPPAPLCNIYSDSGDINVVYNRDVNLAVITKENAKFGGGCTIYYVKMSDDIFDGDTVYHIYNSDGTTLADFMELYDVLLNGNPRFLRNAKGEESNWIDSGDGEYFITLRILSFGTVKDGDDFVGTYCSLAENGSTLAFAGQPPREAQQ